MNLLGVLTITVDTAMVAHLPDEGRGLAAMGFAGDLVFLVTVAMIAVSVGTAAWVSRAHGAGDTSRVALRVGQTAVLSVAGSVAIAVVAPWLAGPALSALGADAPTAALARGYLAPFLWLAVTNFLLMHASAVFRAVGRTRPPLAVAVGMNVLNVVLDYLLIHGVGGLPALGVQGAAVGTVVSQGVAVAALWGLVFAGRVPGLPLGPRDLVVRVPLRDALELGRMAAPVVLDMMLVNVGFLGLVALLGRMDDDAVAAHTLGLRLQMLALMPGFGLSGATGAMVGQALGAGATERAWRVMRVSVAVSVACMAALGALVAVVRLPLLAAVGTPVGTSVGDLAYAWIGLLAVTLPFAGAYHALEGVFHGAGATSVPTRVNAFATLGVLLPVAWGLGVATGWGPWGVWCAFPLAYSVKAALAARGVLGGAWVRG